MLDYAVKVIVSFMNNFWRRKLSLLAGIFFLVLLFALNKGGMYEAKTEVLVLPKNATIARELDSTVDNFIEILKSLAFYDRVAKSSDALESGLELPGYKRKIFWNTKLLAQRVGKSGVIEVINFDKDNVLARELNKDTVDNLILATASYYNIKTELELRIVDGPIVRKINSQNLLATFLQSALWSLLIWVSFFFILPLVFTKKDQEKRVIRGRGFSRKEVQLEKTIPAFIPEEENYFASKNFFGLAKKEAKEILETKKPLMQKSASPLANFSGFGKKAPIPNNLPVSEDDVPDIFRAKEVAMEIDKVEVADELKKTETDNAEYIPHEATPEEVKARLNRLLSGGK